MPGVCPRCLREVYFAEEKLALGKVWHTFCFSCRNCRKLLDSWTVATHGGELFCRSCYTRLFSTTAVRPLLPVPISPIFSSVDKKDLADFPRDTLVSDCCCCCYREENCTIAEATKQQSLELLERSSNCSSEKRRLRGGGGYCEEENLEAATSLELCADKGFSEKDVTRLDLGSSQTTICDQPAGSTALTAWYNKHHSASQRVSCYGTISISRQRVSIDRRDIDIQRHHSGPCNTRHFSTVTRSIPVPNTATYKITLLKKL